MEILQAADFEAYDAFVEAHPRGHFMQTRAWGRVKSAWNWQAVISRDENGAINGSLAVLVRKLPLVPYTMMYAPRGPVCDIYNQRVLAELTEGLKTLAKKHRACVFKTDPDVASSDTTFVELMQGLGYRLNGESKNFEGIQPRYCLSKGAPPRSWRRLIIARPDIISAWRRKTVCRCVFAEKRCWMIFTGSCWKPGCEIILSPVQRLILLL